MDWHRAGMPLHHHATRTMPPVTPIDPIRLFVENALLRLLAELPRDVPGMTVEQRFGSVAAVIRIGTAAEIPFATVPDKLSARQREVYEVVQVEIARLQRRVLGSEVRAALKAAGLRWGTSTINTALADLVSLGLLVNDKDKLGYGLSESTLCANSDLDRSRQ